ncbi:MAG TPA: endonuclease/exonuclease/phosphatase family protein [Vicinamibacterales bacterium]|nr:endonuclease/exonuclease/phosphatase family protein [Vicinamibacterales bacterium]
MLALVLLPLLAGVAEAQPSTPLPADRAVAVAATTALSWRADPKANRYDVYLGTSTPPPAAARNLSTTTFQPGAALQPSTTYYWRVDARGAKNYSAAGPIWTFTTAAPPPPPPSTPTGAAPGPGASNVAVTTGLSWSTASNAASYDVAFGTSAPPPVVSTGQTATTYRPPAPLSYSRTYYWSVTARGAGGTTPGPVWSFTTADAPASTSRDRLRLMTWNVQSGRNADGVFAVDAQAALMADSAADVIALQEVTITADGGDLTVLYKSKLEGLTGVPWYQVWAPEPRAGTFSPEGNVLLSRVPIAASNVAQFDAAPSDPSALDAKQSAAAATVFVNGIGVTIITTRMPQDSAFRQNQAGAFLSWAGAFPAPRVPGGDFEMQPGDSVYGSLTSGYADVWPALADPAESGFTTEARSGSPAATARVDYWLQELVDPHARASEVWVVKTARSDHHALVVDVDVK